jgi:hypothetical protein
MACASYPVLLAMAPSTRDDILFLYADVEAPCPLSLSSRFFRSRLLPLYVERDQATDMIALRFPEGGQYLCAGPGKQGTPSPIAASAGVRREWENFRPVRIPDESITPAIRTVAQVLGSLLDGTPLSSAIIRLLGATPTLATQMVLHAISLLIDLKDLDAIGTKLVEDPSLAAGLGRHLPDDFWATNGLSVLHQWLAVRDSQQLSHSTGCGSRQSVSEIATARVT